jgi:hypothetical protein
MLLAGLDFSGTCQIAGSGRDDQNDVRRLLGAARSGVREGCCAGSPLVPESALHLSLSTQVAVELLRASRISQEGCGIAIRHRRRLFDHIVADAGMNDESSAGINQRYRLTTRYLV